MMGNGRPNLLREVERIVLLLESGEWTDTMPRHPIAQRLQDCLDDLHDEAREPAAPTAYAGVTVWIGAATMTRVVSEQVFNAARGQVDPLKYEFEACRTAVMPQVAKGEGND